MTIEVGIDAFARPLEYVGDIPSLRGHGFGTDLERAEQLLVDIPVKRLPLAGVTCSMSYPPDGSDSD